MISWSDAITGQANLPSACGTTGRMKDTKHLYRTFQFKTEKDWKEYSLKYKVPEEVEKYSALLRNLMTSIRIGAQALAKGGSTKVCLDDISYTIKK